MIEKIDSVLVSAASKVAEKREDITGLSKNELAKIFYMGAGAVYFGDFINDHSVVSLWMGIANVARAVYPWSRLHNIINPRLYHSLAPLILTSSITGFAKGAYNFSSPGGEYTEELSQLLIAVGYSLSCGGEYISRSDTKGPPKKSKLAKLKDKVRGAFSGLNLPRLAPQTSR